MKTDLGFGLQNPWFQPGPDPDNDNDEDSNNSGPDENDTDNETNDKGPCFDLEAEYGVKENPNGQGGCPPKLINYSIVNAEVSPHIPIDAHANYGVHLGER